MKKFVCVLIAMFLFFAVGTSACSEPVEYTLTFVQAGQEDVVIKVKPNEQFVLPTPAQSSDSSLVTEWNIEDDFSPDKDQTINAISYTKGLEFSVAIFNLLDCIKVKKYTGDSTVVVVPAYYKGLPVKILGERSFEGKDNVTKIVLPEGLEKVEYNPFYHCTKIVDVNIPSTLTELASFAFADAHNYGTVTVPSGLRTLPDHSFWGFRGERVVFEDGVNIIGPYVFGGKNSLSEIVLPKSVMEISGLAFYMQPLSKIFYMGDEGDFDYIMFGLDVEDDVDTIEDKVEDGLITVYYYSETQPEYKGDFWHYVDGQPTIWQ